MYIHIDFVLVQFVGSHEVVNYFGCHYFGQRSNLSLLTFLFGVHHLIIVSVHHDPAAGTQVRHWVVEVEVFDHDFVVLLVGAVIVGVEHVFFGGAVPAHFVHPNLNSRNVVVDGNHVVILRLGLKESPLGTRPLARGLIRGYRFLLLLVFFVFDGWQLHLGWLCGLDRRCSLRLVLLLLALGVNVSLLGLYVAGWLLVVLVHTHSCLVKNRLDFEII